MRVQGFDALDEDCPKRWCWAPGRYQHRGATGSGGSRNTGMASKCCLTCAYRGCPSPLPKLGEPSPWGDDDATDGTGEKP